MGICQSEPKAVAPKSELEHFEPYIENENWKDLPKLELPKTLLAYVFEVYDGDTIWVASLLAISGESKLHKYKVRFFYSDGFIVDAPEIRTKDVEEKKSGNESKQFISSLIHKKFVHLETHGFDNFGRILARVYLPGHQRIDVVEELVQKKYAVVRKYP